jgi:hypothetical protein
MRREPLCARKTAAALAAMAFLLAIVGWTQLRQTQVDRVRNFSVTPNSGPIELWDGCKINPKSNIVTRLQIDGNIMGTLSTEKSVSILTMGSNSKANLILEALGPSSDGNSQVRLTLFSNSQPRQTETLFLPLINRHFMIQLQISAETGQFSIGRKPNVVEVPFTITNRLDCSFAQLPLSTFDLPSNSVTQPDSPFTTDVRAHFSQISSNSQSSHLSTIAKFIFFVFLVVTGAFILMRSSRKKIFSLPGSQKLLSIITIQLAVSIPIMWTLSGYFNYDIFGSFVYKSDDGWCRSAIEGVGDHCFGDWNERISPSFFDFQYPSFSTALETSPLGPFWTAMFNSLGRITSPRNLLYISLVLGLIFGFLTVRILVNSTLSRQLLAFSVVLVGGMPWLVALDRMHFFLIVLPFFAFAIRGSIQNNRVLLGRSLLVLALFKPHFALLLLVFANSREWKFLLRYGVLSVIGVITLIALPAPVPITRINQYVMNLLYMADYRPSGTTSYPPNISIRRMLEVLLGSFNLNISQLMLISLIFSSLAMLLCIFLRYQGYFHTLLQLFPFVILGFNGYVPPYYLLFSSVILLGILSSSADTRSIIENSLSHSRIALILFIVAIVASQSLIIVPYGRTQWGGVLTLTPLIAAFFWVAFSLFTIILEAFHYFKLPKPRVLINPAEIRQF